MYLEKPTTNSLLGSRLCCSMQSASCMRATGCYSYLLILIVYLATASAVTMAIVCVVLSITVLPMLHFCGICSIILSPTMWWWRSPVTRNGIRMVLYRRLLRLGNRAVRFPRHSCWMSPMRDGRTVHSLHWKTIWV